MARALDELARRVSAQRQQPVAGSGARLPL